MNIIHKDKDDLAPVCDGGESVTTSTATEPGWLLYYIFKANQLIKSISGTFGQDLMTSCEKLINMRKILMTSRSIFRNEPGTFGQDLMTS